MAGGLQKWVGNLISTPVKRTVKQVAIPVRVNAPIHRRETKIMHRKVVKKVELNQVTIT